jgi:L-ascorbate metabolism protein UlaG (beta-lactamase superfamily)
MMEIQFLRTSMALIRWDWLTILTDPWFAMHLRGLPVYVPPPVDPEDLPRLDLILTSHLHPDHFDAAALMRLSHTAETLVGPPQISERCKNLPIRNIVTLTDGETFDMRDLRIRAFCIEHSGYENAYLLTRKGTSILFAGDASYCPAFKKIGRDFTPAVSLLPVGGTEIIGRRIVMGPREACLAAWDLGTKILVPIHPGGEWMSVPPLSRHPGRFGDLATLAQTVHFPFKVVVLEHGQSVKINDDGQARARPRPMEG